MSTAEIDALGLAQALVRCPSVTPKDEGVLDVLIAALEGLGFVCHRLTFSEDGTADVSNLYARRGTAAPNFCFAGHVDVVPVGDAAAWSADPFAAEVREGYLYGRGAADMKGAIACFAAACARFLAKSPAFAGSLSLLITGDEEGPAINGTAKVLRWMAERDERIDCCLVGEPTNPTRLGEMIKIGRRGSLNGRLMVHGVQGHSAYPELADNPIPRLIAMLDAITAEPRCGIGPLRALDARDHQRRCRQPGEQRHSGRGERRVQRPLQRPPFRGRGRGMAAAAPGRDRRRLRSGDRGVGRVLRYGAGPA